MKKVCRLLIILNIVISLSFIFNISTNTIFAESKDNISINIEDTFKGKIKITYNEITSESFNINIESGKGLSLEALPNEGYKFAGWVAKENNNLFFISDKDFVTFSSLTKDYYLIPYFIKEENYLVKFFASTNLENMILLSVQEVEKNSSANFDFEVPHLRGSSFKKWDHDFSNVQEDLNLRPIYKTTVYSIFRDYAGLFFKGLGMTLLLSVVSVGLGLVVGAILCLMKISRNPILKFISNAYIEVVRGVPLLLQLLVIYMLVPRMELFGLISSEILACVLALFLNSGAYVAEIFRSGIQAVDSGQMEAALALGLTRNQALRKIIIPQGLRNSLPSIGNELISVIKETSLASTVDMSIGELMSVKKMITAGTFVNIEPFIIIAVLYFIVTFSLSKVVRLIERRLEGRD